VGGERGEGRVRGRRRRGMGGGGAQEGERTGGDAR